MVYGSVCQLISNLTKYYSSGPHIQFFFLISKAQQCLIIQFPSILALSTSCSFINVTDRPFELLCECVWCSVLSICFIVNIWNQCSHCSLIYWEVCWFVQTLKLHLCARVERNSQYSTWLLNDLTWWSHPQKVRALYTKIKCNLPSLIRSNSHQSEVTKAEQEKPLTANHSIDRQASPPLPSPLPPFYLLALSNTPEHVQCYIFVSTLHVVIKLNKTLLRISQNLF